MYLLINKYIFFAQNEQVNLSLNVTIIKRTNDRINTQNGAQCGHGYGQPYVLCVWPRSLPDSSSSQDIVWFENNKNNDNSMLARL